MVSHQPPQPFNQIEMRTIGRQKHGTEPIPMLLPKLMKFRGRMCGRIIHHDQPIRLWFTVYQALQMGLDFLVTFSFMDGIEARPIRIDEATKQRIPGIDVPRGVNLRLLPLKDITSPNIGTPMQIGTVKEREFRRSRWLVELRIRGIMAA
jgi:hypothetical protein